MNGLTKWILGALFAVLMAAGGFILNSVVLGGIKENAEAIKTHEHVRMEQDLTLLRRNIAEVRRRQLIVIEQLMIVHGKPAEGPVPPDVMRELLDTGHNGGQ